MHCALYYIFRVYDCICIRFIKNKRLECEIQCSAVGTSLDSSLKTVEILLVQFAYWESKKKQHFAYFCKNSSLPLLVHAYDWYRVKLKVSHSCYGCRCYGVLEAHRLLGTASEGRGPILSLRCLILPWSGISYPFPVVQLSLTTRTW